MDERQLLLAIAGRAIRLCHSQLVQNTKDAETAAAHEQLGKAIENWHAWATSSNEPDRSVLMQGRNCRDCQRPIFFARDVVGRWVPLDTEPVEATEVADQWRYRVNVGIDPPQIWLELEATGRVFLHHRWTCPMSKGPTKAHGPAYRRRYKTYMARLDTDQIQAVDSLRALLRKFDSDDAEGD